MSDLRHDIAEVTTSLNDLVHQRTRLGILTIVQEGGTVDFGYLQDALGLTGGNLSQHLTVLEAAGLVHIEKGYEGRRARTWVTKTRAGTRALRDEVKALKALVAHIEGMES
jgi:DNA-binding MarR family transcriptional regulator